MTKTQSMLGGSDVLCPAVRWAAAGLRPAHGVFSSLFATLLMLVVWPASADPINYMQSVPVETSVLSGDGLAPSKRLSGTWWMEGSLVAIEGGLDQSLNGTFQTRAQFNWRMSHFLDLIADGDFRLQSGFSQFRYRDDLVSFVRPRDIYFRLHRDELFELRLGILGQTDLNSNLLIDGRRAFTGARIGFQQSIGRTTFFLFAQQTVPTSTTVNFYRTDLEPTPWFSTETAQLRWSNAKALNAVLSATHYRFSQLPARVTYESAPEGNTIFDPNIPAISRFAFDFDGISLSTKITLFPQAKYSLEFLGEVIQNNAAEQGYNRGQLLSLAVPSRLGRVEFSPRIATFFNESDTSPSAFNRFDLGNNNRGGNRFDLDFKFLDYDFSLKIRYVRSDVLVERAYLTQLNRQQLWIELETPHVSF